MATPARPRIDTSFFFQQIAQSPRSTLVLDFDTTWQFALAARPSAFPLPTFDELLDCLIMARRTRVVVASTHAARDVAACLHPPYPEIWGRNGLERIPAAPSTLPAVACILHPRLQSESISRLLANLSARGPVAYLMGEGRPSTPRDRLLVRPQLHLSDTEVSFGLTEDLLQFLMDWLRACAGEIC